MKNKILIFLLIIFSNISFAQKCCSSLCDDNISLWTARDLTEESVNIIWVKIQQFYDQAENKSLSKEDRYFYYTKVIEYTEKLCIKVFNQPDPQDLYLNALLGKVNLSLELKKPCQEVLNNFDYAIKKWNDVPPSYIETFEMIKRSCK